MWVCVVVIDRPATYSHGPSHNFLFSSRNSIAGGAPGFYVFLLLVSFFWTLQVVGGVLNCTVAGTSLCSVCVRDEQTDESFSTLLSHPCG